MMGFGGSIRLTPDVQQACKVDAEIMKALHKFLLIESFVSGGFSKKDYHNAELDLYVSAGFFVRFEKGFRVPNCLMEHLCAVANGILVPTPNQPVIHVGPARRKRNFKAWRVLTSDKRNCTYMIPSMIMDKMAPSLIQCYLARRL